MYHVPGAVPDYWSGVHEWDYYTEPQTDITGWKGNDFIDKMKAGKLVGGSSTINGLLYTRGSRHDFDRWKNNGCEDWGYEDVLPMFLRSEDWQSSPSRTGTFHSTGGFLGVTESKHVPLTDVFIEAGKELGFEHIDINSDANIGFGEMQFNIKDGARSTPARHLLRGASMRGNLDVSITSQVSKIIIKNKIAIGVELLIGARKMTIQVGREVVVSAGAIGSPKLLMLSGVGPKEELEKLSIAVEADLPVGENLQNHVAITLVSESELDTSGYLDRLAFWRYILFRSGPLSTGLGDAGVAFIKSDERTERLAPDIQLVLLKDKFPSGDIGMSIILFLLQSLSRGTVKLRSANQLDAPIVDPKYILNKTHLANFISGIRTAEQLWNTNAMKAYNTSINLNRIQACENYEFKTDPYWECFIRNMLWTASHPVGTCKMGPVSDQETVVDPRLRVKGIQSLRVIDASIMPDIVSANINAATIMIGEKGAQMMIDDLLEV